MSDIPIGSPPVPPGRHAAASGWYPDPVDPRNERYWDGWQWGRDTRPGPAAGTTGSGQAAPRSAPVPPSAPIWAQQPTGQGSAPGGSAYGTAPGYGAAPAGSAGSGKATTTADGVPLAGWGWRFLAMVLDYVFVTFLTAIPAAPVLRDATQRMTELFQRTLEAAQNNQPPPTVGAQDILTSTDQLVLSALTLTIGMAYHLIFLRLKRATPGKLIVGLRVVPQGQGTMTGPLPWRLAVTRSVCWMAPQVVSCLWIALIVDGLFPLWQRNRQSLHDLVARTQVIRSRR